jgi:DNA (cytosine-5)-methyltransferase 3A
MRFVEAVRQIQPRFFLYENVASMPQSIKAYISEELGIEPILINSALVSAQHRKRLYWTNIKGVTQPDDKKILLRDIIQTGITARDKSLCIDACYYKGGNHTRPQSQSGKRNVVFEAAVPVRVGEYAKGGQCNRIYSVRGKSIALTANGGGHGGKVGLYKVDLPDGDYIIRKLTPIEAERCQTLPDDYTAFGVDSNGKTVNISNSQRYKCIGNGWTIEVIAHILSFMD